MDFFEAQEAARRRTSLLIGLFALAVLAIVAVIYGVLHLAVGPGPGPVDLVLLVQVAFGVGLLIAVGAGVRTASLRRGGPAVAELLGGRRVASDTSDPAERKLLNVVEEMAIASGTPVPAVYVLDAEDGINAFAAGYSTHDAAVAVTRGGLLSLTRDELQGVMAHEFSHILNGDMRLNIRLIGVLYGILLLAVVGRGIVYAGPRGGGRRGGRDGGAGWVVLLGLALLLVGYVGVFFGKLIKAAVSRQREYLADSAAVQFTRNPEGLAGALKKIGAQAAGSRIQDHHAEELSHLFFANGLRSTLFGFLATHPPLEERIRRLDPRWTGELAAGAPREAIAERHAPAASRHGFEEVVASRVVGAAPAPGSSAPAPPARSAPGALVASVGAPTPEHLAYASALLESVPEPLRRAAHDAAGAEALVFALVMAGSPQETPEEWELVRGYGGAELQAAVASLLPRVREQRAEMRLPLLDLALPALLSLSPAGAERFRAALARLIFSDGRVRMFEYAVIHTLARRLGGGERGRGGRTRSLASLRGPTETLLSAVAWAGADGRPEAAGAAFEAAVRQLPDQAGGVRLQPREAVDLGRIDAALTALEDAAPEAQRRLLEACAASAMHDRRLSVAESEILRAIAESLDCPMPPLLEREQGTRNREQ